MIGKLKSLKNHQGFMKYFKNTSWLFFEKILRMVVGLFVGIWVARYLGPEQFGLFSYAQSFVGLFVVISTLGIDNIIVRELLKTDDARYDLIGTAFLIKLIGAIIVLIILAIVINFTANDSYTNTLIFIIASASIFQSFNVIDFYFQSKVMSKYVVYANIVSLFISSIIKVTLILNEASLIAFAWVILFDSLVIACGYIFFYFKHHLSIKSWKFDKNIGIDLLKDSWPFIFVGTIGLIQARIDQVMIKEMIGSLEVGYYSVALRLIESVAFSTTLVYNSFLPGIISAKNYSIEMYRTRLLNFYRLNFILFLVVAIPIFLFANGIVLFLYGNAYESSGILLSLMAVRLFFANMGTARQAFIVMENMQKYAMLTLMLGTVVNVGLNYLWIEEYGARGAIVATICSWFVTVFLIDSFYKTAQKNFVLQLKAIVTFFKLKI